MDERESFLEQVTQDLLDTNVTVILRILTILIVLHTLTNLTHVEMLIDINLQRNLPQDFVECVVCEQNMCQNVSIYRHQRSEVSVVQLFLSAL